MVPITDPEANVTFHLIVTERGATKTARLFA